MQNWKFYTVALIGLAITGSGVWTNPAMAKPDQGRGRGNAPVTITQPVTGPIGAPAVNAVQLLSFSSNQRSLLVNLLRGSAVRPDILDAGTRSQILSQVSSLPPGIQKRLVRGKGLPPGIAKKVALPKTVNTYLNLPAQYDLYMVGSNVVLYNTVTNLVSDLITSIF